jgi:predicted enzyme related to lactoylglutathione lyase
MKRMHVHVRVEDVERSIGFYSALFSSAEHGQIGLCQWMLDDPR